MNIEEFIYIFLPNLIKQYNERSLDFHALVDVDLWKLIFPDELSSSENGRLFWYQIRLNCFELKDKTLLLTYTLPTPLQKGQPKFAGIRLNRDTRQVHYYILNKPQRFDDPWDILWMPFPKAADIMKLEFNCKIDGTDSLRNFVLTVQRIEYNDAEYGRTLISSIFHHLKDTIAPMEL